ncbi:MAG: transcription-repair coupling factor [Lachnospiraceae bacterium]|nr:transcription-repair coupling factor [Lachnospiraceae bacterium]
MAKSFNSSLHNLPDFERMQQALLQEEGPVCVSGCVDSQLVHLTRELTAGGGRILFLTYNEVKAREIWEDAQTFWEGEPRLYPARDLLFSQADVRGSLLSRQRMTGLRALLEEENALVVTTVDALLCRLMTPAQLKKARLRLKPGDVQDPRDLARKLAEMGYEREAMTRMPGDFSLRGGILDVFPLTRENPVRIEFFDDEIDSLRLFDSETQRSLSNLEEVMIYPTQEILSADGCLLDYLGPRDFVVLDEPERMEEKARGVTEEYQESAVRRLEAGQGDTLLNLFSPEELWRRLDRGSCLILTGLPYRNKPLTVSAAFSLSARALHSYGGQMDLLVTDLRKMVRQENRIILLCGSRSRGEWMSQRLEEEELPAFYVESTSQAIFPGQILITIGNIHHSYELPSLGLVILAEGELFGKKKKGRRQAVKKSGGITRISDLNVGDYVIHEDHGVGIFGGIVQRQTDDVVIDYIRIDYRDGGQVFTPVSLMNKIEKYASRDVEHPPALSRLGGAEWRNTKARVKKAVGEIAKDLVQLYAARQQDQGFVFSPDGFWQREFEEQFPYEETEDQIQAIQAVKEDMESRRIMDRLICGDVGFGKTEIAIRAAFKAVQDSKQVAYLVPTTVLAQQHYLTFAERMREYPIRVGLLSRFRTPAEQKKAVADLKSGALDIVIGTHRLLSQDVQFKDLGLLIIDEEQRFGVSDKEKLKKLRETVDVISLTATPIPRTLHMSLIGIRDMSMLKDPPMDRLPIQTYVAEYNEEIVREAIARELARGGQVYYICNKVKNIETVTARIAALVPEAEVTFAHGQMRERELERIMFDFVNGQIDVLVSTTIVETGLDIPNVNTIIIQDSDRFGLAQLYQLRGRVGRSNRTAYAFLFYQRGRLLKDVAEKRLMAIRDYTELGSGVKISMRDLELRGAGNLLGAEQHGHMQAVGYELYAKLLGEAVSREKGEAEKFRFDTSVEIEADAHIPTSYIPNESQKLAIYHRIAEIENEGDYDDVLDELIDRFGDLPRPVDNLLKIALIKTRAHKLYVTELEANQQEVRMRFLPEAPLDPMDFAALLQAQKGSLKLRGEEAPVLTRTFRKGEVLNPQGLLVQIGDLLGVLELHLMQL